MEWVEDRLQCRWLNNLPWSVIHALHCSTAGLDLPLLLEISQGAGFDCTSAVVQPRQTTGYATHWGACERLSCKLHACNYHGADSATLCLRLADAHLYADFGGTYDRHTDAQIAGYQGLSRELHL